MVSARVVLGSRLVFAALSLLGAAFAVQVFRRIRARGAMSMASFHLKPDAAVRDFALLLGFALLHLGGFTAFIVATFGRRPSAALVARGFWLAAFVVIAVLMYRWWRRFRYG